MWPKEAAMFVPGVTSMAAMSLVICKKGKGKKKMFQ